VTETLFIAGMLAGLACAFSQSLCYLFSRDYVTRSGHTSGELFALSHVWMGVLAAAAWPFLRSPDCPAFATYVWPLLSAGAWYLAGQVGLFTALRWTDASRVSPLLGLKILMLAGIAAAGLHSAALTRLVLLRPVNAPQWVAVAASVLAALILNQAGGRIPVLGAVCILFTCVAYSFSDLSIGVLVERLRSLGELHGALYGCCVTYISTGLVGALLVLRRRPPALDKWRRAFPVALSWLAAMSFLYISFKLVGVLFGNIMQSTRGLISIGLAVLMVRWNLLHLETRVERGVFWRRAAAAILMAAAIVAFMLGRQMTP